MRKNGNRPHVTCANYYIDSYDVQYMNGLAKASGILSIAAGLVFLVAVILGVMDGLSFTDDTLEAFEAVKKFRYISGLAGILAAMAGYVAVTNGVIKKNVAFSVYGIFLILLGAVIAVCANKGNMNTLTYDQMVTVLTAVLVAVACAFGLGCAKERNYALADVAIILAFVVIIVFALDLKILVPLVEMIIVIVLGVLLMIVKPKPVAVAEPAEEQKAVEAEEERKVVPAAPAVPAAPPVAKPAAEEEAAAADNKAAAAEKKAAAAPAEKKAEAAAAAEKKADAAAEKKAEAAAADNKVAAESKTEAAAAEKNAEAAAESKSDAAASSASATEAAGAAAAGAVAGAAAAAASEEKEEEPAKEKSELDRLLEQGWNVTVATVGEDRACEMSDYEIMAVISVADPELYKKLSALTGIVVSTGDEEPAGEMSDDDLGLSDEDLGLIPDTPSGFVRRACWNKGLRCRKDYGPYYIPFAFVKSKVAVYIDGDTPDNRNDEALQKKSWIVLHFKEADVTDGQKEAEVVYDAVKENTRALKKAKTKKKKR